MLSSRHSRVLKYWVLRGGLFLLSAAFMLGQSTPVGRSTDADVAYQQNIIRNLYFNVLSDKTGLIDNVNAFIHHDSRGFVWFSSMSGLNRFDGTKVKQYATNSRICPQSPFFETKNGDIWFTTVNTIQVYRRKSDKLEQFLLKTTSGDTLVASYHAFFLDKQERLWIRISEKSEKSYIFDTQTYKQQAICEIPYMRIKTHLNEQTHQLSLFGYNWTNNGFRQYIFADSTNLANPIIKDWTPQQYPLLKDLTIYVIQPMGDTAIWLGTNQGLVYFDLVTQKLKKFNTIPTIIAIHKNEMSVGNVKSIALLSNDLLAVGTTAQGLLLFNIKSQQFDYQYYPKPYEANGGSMPFTEINDLYLDHKYNLWVSNWSSGIAYANLKTQTWEHVTLAQLPKKFEVTKILARSNGEIWAMSNDEGIAVTNQKGTILRYFTQQDLPIDRYIHAQEDSLGRVWLAGRSHAVVYVPTSKKFHLLNREDKEIAFKYFATLPDNKVVGLTRKGELYHITIKSDGQIEYNLVQSLSSFSKHLNEQGHKLKMIFSDEKEMYAITADTIYQLFFDPSVRQWNIEKTWKHNIKNTNIYSLCNRSFIMVNNDYVFHLDKKTKKLSYISNSALNIGTIESALDIDNHEILIVAQGKIFVYNLDSHVHKLVAMPTQSLSFGNIYLKNKEIWLGTYTGILKLKPTEFNVQSETIPIQLTRLQINDELDYQAGNVSEISHFYLPSNNRTLTFDMTAISYNNAFRPQLRYKLERIDNEWLMGNGAAAVARYAKLYYGKYHLIIQALDTRTNMVLETKEIDIEIETPIGLRAWAIVLYVVISLGVVWLLILMWMKRTHKELNMQRELSEKQIISLRAQISPHFVVNSVTSISSLIKKHLNVRALESVKHFSTVLHKTLDASTKDKITLQDEIMILKSYVEMEKIIQDIDIEFNINYDNNIIDPEEVEIPGLVLQLFVENAIKHGILKKEYLAEEKRCITIKFELKHIDHVALLECIVTDNGIGYNPNAIDTEIRVRKSLGMRLVRERLELILGLRQHRSTLDSIKDKLLRKNKKIAFQPVIIKCLYNEHQKVIGTQTTVTIPLEEGY